jgi:hypothetical protein
MATTIRVRMLALLKRRESEGLSFRDLSEISGEPIGRLADYHRVLFKTHPGVVEILPARGTAALESSKSFDVTLTSGVRAGIAPGFDAPELARLIATLESRC